MEEMELTFDTTTGIAEAEPPEQAAPVPSEQPDPDEEEDDESESPLSE
jgi:hypothetical protein